MTLRTQLRLLLLGIGLMWCLLLGLMQRASHLVLQEQQTVGTFHELVRDVFDFNLVTNDYQVGHHDRALQQMTLRMATLQEVIHGFRARTGGRLEPPPGMLQELATGTTLLARLRVLHQRVAAEYGVDLNEQVDPFLHQQVEDLASDLSISAIAIVNQAQRGLTEALARQGQVIQFYNRLRLGVLSGSFLLILVAVVAFARRLGHGLGELMRGTARIGAGDLSTRLPERGQDELTDLTRSVNAMAGQLEASYAVLRQREGDIRRLNQDLEGRMVRLDQANKELEAFSYTVSHDLRAPLRHITGFVELLERRDTSALDEKSRHYLQVISAAARKMGCLIDDLLAFSRMGRSELLAQPVDLAQLTREVIDDLKADLPPDRGIQWRVGELPVVRGDRSMLRQVLVNLLGNAVKYSSHTPEALIEVGAAEPDKDCQAFYVRDNGAGFDMNHADKLFGLFQRLHASTEYEGTGVGLASVRRIIARHGGRTWAEGALGQGATFHFTLPLPEEMP